MKFLAFLFAALLGIGGAQAASPVLTLSTNNTPSDRRALEEISREAFRRVGYDVKVIMQPSERSLQSADAGEVDGEGLRIPGLSEQYRNLIPIPERFIGISFVAFARKDATVKLDQGWASLKPYRVAFITGWKMFEANASDARVVTKVNAPEQLFRMLDSDRTDFALYTRADGNALLRKLSLGSIVQLEPSLKDVDLHLYMHKKHEQLVPRVAQALRDMRSDGTTRRILGAIAQD